MIRRLEGTRTRQFATQHPGREWQSCKNTHSSALSFGEEEIARALPKHIENDLHGLHGREFDRLERFFDFLNTDAVVSQLAGFDELVEHAENLWHVVNFHRRTM